MTAGDLGFSWRATKDGRIRISRDGRVVTSLAGEAAARFRSHAKGADFEAQQQLMARATGNYKRGNERRR
jgi:hypothetical protein